MRVVVTCDDYTWRPLTDSDADTRFVMKLRNDPRFAGMFIHKTAITPDLHREFMRRAAAEDEINWLIERSADAAPMGLSAMYNFDSVDQKCESGRVVMLEPRLFHLNWLVSGFIAFDVLKLASSYIETLEENRTIARGVERMGMQQIAQRDNTRIFSITVSEFHAFRDAGRYAQWGEPELVSMEKSS